MIDVVDDNDSSIADAAAADDYDDDNNDDNDDNNDDNDDNYDEEEGSGQRKSKRIKRNTWTLEEDAIIVREYKNNPGNYSGAAMNHLPGRSRHAITDRWYTHLKKHYPSATI